MEESGAVLIKRCAFDPQTRGLYPENTGRFENPYLKDDVDTLYDVLPASAGDRLIKPLLGTLEPRAAAP